MSNRYRWLAVVVCGVLCVLCFLRARSLIYSPDLMPGWDASGYVLRGLNIHDALVNFDLEELQKLLLKPDIRPPAFSVMLGSFMLVAGTDITVGTLWAQAAFFVSLGLMVVLGHRIGGVSETTRSATNNGGIIAGALAAVLVANGLDHLALIMVPMSESTTFLTMVGVSLGLVYLVSKGPQAQVVAGLLLLWAGLIRYNLPAMLGGPLVVWHVYEALRFRTRPLWKTAYLGWVVPGVVYFGGWYLLKPELPDQIEKFLVNRSSGLEFWSQENLLFFPHALADSFLGPLGWGVMALFVVGLIPLVREVSWLKTSPELRLLQFQVLAGIAALTLHDYKLDRNLYGTLPALYLCALVPYIESRGGVVLALVAATGFSGFSWNSRIPTILDKYHFEVDPSVNAALEFLLKQAQDKPRLWVTGANDALSPPLIEIYLRSHGRDVQLSTKALALTERTRTGIDPSWNEQYQTVVNEEFLTDKNIGRTSFVTIETLPGSRRFKGGQKWTNYQNNYAKAFTQQTRVPEVDRVAFPEGGLQLVAYRAADAVVIKKSPGGKAVPVFGAPLYEEAFSGEGEGWTLVPEKELPAEGIYHGEGIARFTIPLPATRLQYCGPVVEVPAAFTARFEVNAANLQGRSAVLQVREVDATGTLIKNEAGEPQIHRVGPVKKDGQQDLFDEVSLMGGAPGKVKMCVILEGFSGEFSVDRVSLYPSEDASAGN